MSQPKTDIRGQRKTGEPIIITNKLLELVEDKILNDLRNVGIVREFDKGSKITSFLDMAVQRDVMKLAPFYLWKEINAKDYYDFWILHHWSKPRFREALELWQKYGLIVLSSPLSKYYMRKGLPKIMIRLTEES